MDIVKVLQHGLKVFVFVVIGSLLTVLISALTVATTGFNPSGVVDPFVWKFLGLPLLIGIIGALDNLRKHLPK